MGDLLSSSKCVGIKAGTGAWLLEADLNLGEQDLPAPRGESLGG
jgi:hypothetical protein